MFLSNHFGAELVYVIWGVGELPNKSLPMSMEAHIVDPSPNDNIGTGGAELEL